MLYILFSTIILLPVISGFGKIFQEFFDELYTGISSQLLAGIFSVSILFTITAFFIPLYIFVELTTILIGLSLFFYFKLYNLYWNFFKNASTSFYIIAIVTIFFGSFYPYILDHFGYYVPTIKWLSEIGLVKGISNLDLILGQMSIWHILQAGFSNFTDPFLRINVFVLIIYIIYIFEKKVWIHLIPFPLLFLFSQSPSPDLPVIVISLILLNEFLALNKNSFLLFTISMFVFALKPTMVWVPIFSFLYSLILLKSSPKFIVFGFFVFVIFIFKNIWTFGFPIFPMQLIDLGFSWKPNAELLKNSSEIAVQKTFDMQFSISEIANFSSIEYIKNWLFLSGLKGKIHLLFVLSIVVFLIFSIYKKSKIIWLLFISILIKSILILVFSAQYRFFLEVFFVIFFVLFYVNTLKSWAFVSFTLMSFVLFAFLTFPQLIITVLPSFKLGSFITGFSKNQYLKPAHFELKKYRIHQIGNLQFNLVEDYPFSFDTPLPAISPAFVQEDLEAGIFPQLKGKSIKNGFIWRKISQSEKIQIERILDRRNEK